MIEKKRWLILLVILMMALNMGVSCREEDPKHHDKQTDPCTQLVQGTGTPEISFTDVPAYGSFDDLKGRVLHVIPNEHKVAVYIYVPNYGWVNKPYWKSPKTNIACDGTFTTDTTTGANDELAIKYIAYLIPASAEPPILSGEEEIPLEIEDLALAFVEIDRPEPIIKYQLTIDIFPINTGTVIPDSGEYEEGTILDLTATPIAGWKFDHWIGTNNNTVNPTTVTMTANKSVTAVFVEIPIPTYTLTTVISPVGKGSIAPASGTYNKDTVVNLTATPIAGWKFDHWVGTNNNTVNPTTVTMTANKSVTAVFVEIPIPTYTLTTVISPVGKGSIAPASGTYNKDTVVNLTATPIAGWKFDHWVGTNNNTVNPTTVTMTANKSVTAVFVEIPIPTYTLTTVISPVGKGSIAPASGTYNKDTVVNLTATPIAGWKFDHWVGTNNNTVNPTTVTMTANKSVTAVFVEIPIPTYFLITEAVPYGSGTISPAAGTYNEGQKITLTPTANPGWKFDHWQGADNNTANPGSVTMTSDKQVLAYFISTANYKIDVSFSPFTTGVLPGTVTEEDLENKLKVIQAYVNWIRTFACTQGMENAGWLAHQMGLKIAVGASLSSDTNKNQLEINSIIAMAKAGDADLLIIGNEVLLFNKLTEQQVINYINQVKAAVPDLLITYSDTYNTLLKYPQVVAACDVVYANIYPYWEGIEVEHAIFYTRNIYQNLLTKFNKPVIIAEAGWPSEGLPFLNAIPSPENAAYHFNNFVSWARAENIPYFYFEAFDEPWKAAGEGEVGAHWGIWDKNLVMKAGMQDVFAGLTTADNWSGLVEVGGPGTPGVEITYLPPLGSYEWIEGQVNHVKPGEYQIAVFIGSTWGFYNKPTWDNPGTIIFPDGYWTCDYTTGANDQNATEFDIFLVPKDFVIPLVNGGVIPQSVYDNAVDYLEITR